MKLNIDNFTVFIDGTDLDLVKEYHWRVSQRSARTLVQGDVGGKVMHLGRLITGAKLGQVVVYENDNWLDNRRDNLKVKEYLNE